MHYEFDDDMEKAQAQQQQQQQLQQQTPEKTSVPLPPATATPPTNSTKNSAFDNIPLAPSKTATGPSPFRQLLPVFLCLLSFATVLSVLIIYTNTTEIRHQQFRLNMSRDYELSGVQQDNPSLVTYVREVHMKKYPNMGLLANAGPPEHLNFTNRHELTPEMARYVVDLLAGRTDGVFFQSLTGAAGPLMTAPWLAESANWTGSLVEPDPRKYFSLRKENAHRRGVQVIHACLSPNGYAKEVTLHADDESEVRINSILDEETEWFHSRVKCFPLYTLLLAVNQTQIDLLSLGCGGQELQILQTVPFDKVQFKVISIHLQHRHHVLFEESDADEEQEEAEQKAYLRSIVKFLLGKSYKLKKSFENNHFFQKISAAVVSKKP